MDPFSYLSILISIVFGLSIAHLLGALVRVVLNRARHAVYWPSLIYALILFVIIVQAWWADFSLNQHEHWTFAAFASTLLIPADLYLLCAILLPSGEVSGAGNMRTAFEDHRVWFFGGLFALPMFSFAQELLVSGHISAAMDSSFKLIFAALALTAMLVRLEWVQKSIAIAGLVLIVIYVSVLFSTLP